MDEINLLELIKRRFAALMAGIDPRADPKLAAEVPATLAQADSDLPAVFMRARRVLEIIVLDIYRRELPTAKPKPLADMIEALYAQQGLVSKRVAADLHYIRVNGNLIIHPQDEAVEVRAGDAEPVLLVFLSVVEWYLTVYLPERLGEAPARAPTLPPPPNPYRGLLAFREADAANWFGREPDAADLLAAVARQPLVAVVGPSGSGKSSLVYAGVVPGLRPTEGLRIADFRPRGRPFAELAQALVALWPIDPADRLAQARKLAAHLADGQVTLTDAVQETLRQTSGSRLVLIADQFEELYTLGQSGDDTQGFTDLLAQAVQEGLAVPNRAGPPELCLLLTLRADFLGHALAHPGLAALLDRCPPKLLGPVEDRTRLRAIIEQPARGVGVVLEDLLPERILRDLSQLPGTADQIGGASLPLLEFALAQLWGQQQERRLTHRGYEELGGIQQALSRHADGVLARLDPLDQARMRHVLVQMVRPGEGTEDTRQVATRDQLRPDDWPLVVRLADADTRLVVTGHDETTEQDTAEIVHETLIRHWQPLRDWLNADRAFRLWQNGLRQAMAEWARTGQDDGALLAGARLAEAEERIATDAGRVSEAEVRYVQASVGRRDAEAAERERQRRERERLQRRISQGLAGFLVVALVLGGFAGWQWWIAEQRRAEVAAKKAELATSLEQETQAKAAAVKQQRRAQEQALAASQNLARVHEEKLIGILNQAEDQRTTRDYQEALLQALQAQRQPIGGGSALSQEAFAALDAAPLDQAFAQRWSVPVGGTGLAFSPDGRLIASSNEVGQLVLRDSATGDILRKMKGQWGIVAFSPDGRLLASASEKTLRLGDPATGALVRTLEGHQGKIRQVAFSPNGNLLASASMHDGSVRLWDLATGTLKHSLAHEVVTAIAFSPEGDLLVTADERLSVRYWDPGTGKEMPPATGQVVAAYSLAFSRNGRMLALGLGAGVLLRELTTSAIETRIARDQGMVTSVAFSPDGRLFASAARNDPIPPPPVAANSAGLALHLWNPATGKVRRILEGDQNRVETLAFSPSGHLIASVSGSDWGETILRLWDSDTREKGHTLVGHREEVHAVAYSPDGRLLASASGNNLAGASAVNEESKDNTVRLWNAATGALLHTLNGHQKAVNMIAFSPNGKMLASASNDETVRLWNLATGETVHVMEATGYWGPSVAFSPDSRLLATLSKDNTVSLWDAGTAAAVRNLKGHQAKVTSVAFAPDGRLLASASEDKTVRLWDPSTGATVRRLEGHQDTVRAVVSSPDGRILASGAGGHFDSESHKALCLWDPETGALMRTLRTTDVYASSDVVYSIAFSPAGHLLATRASRVNDVHVWESATGAMIHTIEFDYPNWVNAHAFSPDGRQIATPSGRNIVLRDLGTALLLANGFAPSPRAALISEALQRVWGLRVDGLAIVPETWTAQEPHHGTEVIQEFTIDIRPAAETADPASQPILRTFDIRPLLDPPPPDKDKLDQFLDWLAEQERLEPRLRAQCGKPGTDHRETGDRPRFLERLSRKLRKPWSVLGIGPRYRCVPVIGARYRVSLVSC